MSNVSIVDTISSGELLLFRTLWNDSNDNMFIVNLNKNGDFISESTNPSLEKTFGLKPNEVDGKRLQDILDEDTYNLVCRRYHECIDQNSPITYEENIILQDKERFWNTTILPVRSDDGTVRIFGISREITQLKILSKELQKINETLELKVEERTKELTQSLEEIKRISIHDHLTGLYNRLKLDECLENEIKRSSRSNETFGLILLDIDHFKEVNDTYGHLIGDIVLKEFAHLLQSNARTTDIVGRWGGEEFLMICPNTHLEGLEILAENLRQKIENFLFTKVPTITASLGITTYTNTDDSDTIIKRVDDALYEAKDRSRNCVIRK